MKTLYGRKSMFAIEDGPEYVGYTTGEGWKVYESPYFEKEVVEQIFVDAEDVVWGYNALQDYYTYHLLDHSIEDVNDLPVVHGTFIETIEGTKHVYQLGAGSWIWSERSNFDKYILSASKTHSWVDEYAIGHAYSWEDAQRWITNRMKEESCFMVTVWQKNKEEEAQVIKKYYKEDKDKKEYCTFEIHTFTEETDFQNFLKEYNIDYTITLSVNTGTWFFEVKCTKPELDLCKHFLEHLTN